jgi:hypothetical protein
MHTTSGTPAIFNGTWTVRKIKGQKIEFVPSINAVTQET